MDVLSDHGMTEDQTVLHDSPFLDLHAAANDRILHRAVNGGSVRNHRIDHAGTLIIVNRAGVRGLCIDRPVRREQLLRRIVIQKLYIRTVVAQKIINGCHIRALVLRTADVQAVALQIQNVRQVENRGALLRLMDQMNEHLLAHHIGVHENIAVRRRTIIHMDRLHALLTVQIQNGAVAVPVIRLVGLVIQERDIRAALHMLLQELLEILFENHIAGCDDHIRLLHSLDHLEVVHERGNVRVVNVVDAAVLIEQELELASFGIDVVVLAVAQMLRKRTRILADIDLNAVDAAVRQIGYREIHHTVSPEEGEGADRAVILHSLYMIAAIGGRDDSECIDHLTQPPLHSSRQGECSHCPHFRLQRPSRCARYWRREPALPRLPPPQPRQASARNR